jgi:hypothetical protein
MISGALTERTLGHYAVLKPPGHAVAKETIR